MICSHTWNRWPLSCRSADLLQHCSHGQLDYELVLRDQRMQDQLTRIPRKVKVQLRNFLTKRHPEVPIPSFTVYSYKDEDDISAPDRTYMVDSEGNVVVDVVMKQYMKQQREQERAWRRDLEEKMVGENIWKINTEATKLQREGIHNHCRTCVITECSIGKLFDPSRWRESCPIIDCRWGCGAKYHACKSQDHSFLCKLFRESDDMDWLRRLQVSNDIVEQEEEGEERRKYLVHVGASDDTDHVPDTPDTLMEPTQLDLNIETIHRMHVKPVNIRSFICGKVFRRDEIHQHIINVHQEIIPGLGCGWILSRCPLSYLGCSYAIDNLAPNTEQWRIKFSPEDDNFCLRLKDDRVMTKNKKKHHVTMDCLPVEIIYHITQYLDSISLRSLSLVSARLRTLCHGLARSRGCVTPVWERQRALGHRRTKTGWTVVSYRWFFSTAMVPVHSWLNINIGQMQHHLQTCRFYQTNVIQNRGQHQQFQQLKEELKKRVELKQKSAWFIQ